MPERYPFLFPAERTAILATNPWLEPWQEARADIEVVNASSRRMTAGIATRARLVAIDFRHCQRQGGGYSWPGSCIDRTARGVYLHEVGHIVHYSLPNEHRVVRRLRALGGLPVSGYEPNVYETFAETFRVFAGNAALLEAGRPWRYQYFRELGINPPEGTPYRWEEGLAEGAPQRFFDMCERWIARGLASRRMRSFA